MTVLKLASGAGFFGAAALGDRPITPTDGDDVQNIERGSEKPVRCGQDQGLFHFHAAVARQSRLPERPHYEVTGEVVAIVDGNTLTILDGTKNQNIIRLAGIDAPEKGHGCKQMDRAELSY